MEYFFTHEHPRFERPIRHNLLPLSFSAIFIIRHRVIVNEDQEQTICISNPESENDRGTKESPIELNMWNGKILLLASANTGRRLRTKDANESFLGAHYTQSDGGV